MQHADPNTPANWLQYVLNALQWPVIVGSAFWLGRYVENLRARVMKAELNVTALIERHMPALHRALAEIRGVLLARGNK